MLETGLKLKREGLVELLHDRLSYRVEGYALLNRLVESCDVYIVGGFVRDLLIYGDSAEESRDIDVVVKVRDREGFKRAIEGTEFIINRFGGYKFLVGDCEIDLWELGDTFGIREGEDVGVSDFIECMHVTTDRLAYDFGRDVLYADEVECLLEHRELDLHVTEEVVEAHIEVVMKDLIRCYYYGLKYGFTLSERVGELTREVLNRVTVEELLDTMLGYQMHHFKEIRVSRETLLKIVGDLTGLTD